MEQKTSGPFRRPDVFCSTNETAPAVRDHRHRHRHRHRPRTATVRAPALTMEQQSSGASP